MNFANIIISSLAPSAKIFENATKNPRKAQERVLLKYLARNRNTEYGLKYDFSAIGSADNFRERVPLSDYQSIKPYIDRMKCGEAGILTSDKVTFFGITSGSTGDPKFIPVTRYSQARKNDLMNIWAFYLAKDHPKIFDGKTLAIISPEVKNYTQAGIPYGPEDGHAYNNLPDAVRRLYSLPYDLFYIDDYEARYYCMLRISMEQNITNIATLNPSTLTLLCEKIPHYQTRIIDDIERGTLDAGVDVIPDIRLSIEKGLRPNPKRAKDLRAILAAEGKLLPRHFWPKLEAIECWKGGTVKSYLSRLAEYFGETAVRDFGCLATEARSSIPLGDEGSGGVLALNTNFYEFIPREDIDNDEKRTLLCDELQIGKEYLIIVTTPGGLYRYNIDDVVRVSRYYNQTPVVEFVQKGHNVISLTGEKVYESHVEEAIVRAVHKCRVALKGFTATVVKGSHPRYVFLAEFAEKILPASARVLLVSIEEELRGVNGEYEDLRRQQLIEPPSLRILKPGELERYRMSRIKNGSHETQFKMPKLVSSEDFLGKFVFSEEIFM